MKEVINTQMFKLITTLFQALSIGFGVGWVLKKFLSNVINKFEKIQDNQKTMKKRQKKILKTLIIILKII